MKKIKEWFRKRLVSIKRNPSHIPLFFLIVTCLILNLYLTSYSNTVADINEPRMGVYLFVLVLASFLMIISYLTAYPRHREPKKGIIALVNVMILISIVCEVFLYYLIIYGTELKEHPIEITKARAYINTTKTICFVHAGFLLFSLLMIDTLPIYAKWLQKIDTSIKVEEIKVEEIDIEDGDNEEFHVKHHHLTDQTVTGDDKMDPDKGA